MKGKQGLPIDLGAIYDIVTGISDEGSQAMRLGIAVDGTAGTHIVDVIRHAFVPRSTEVSLSVSYFGDDMPSLDVDVDCILMVMGGSLVASALVETARVHRIPLAIVTDDLPGCLERADAMSHSLPMERMVGLDVASDPDDVHFLDQLADLMGDVCKGYRLALASAFPFMRHQLSLGIVRETSLQNAAVGAIPFIPGADMPIMTANQVKMTLEVAAVHGLEMDVSRALELVCVVSGGFVCRTVARELVGIVPGFGWAMKAGIGYSGTYAMGRALLRHIEGDRAVDRGKGSLPIEGIVSSRPSGGPLTGPHDSNVDDLLG